MNPSPFNGRVALAAAVIVTAGAFIGSASSLYAIGTHALMAAPWSLPVSLDLAAVGAAAAIRCRRTDSLAWFTLVTATAISTVMQVLDAPADLLSRVSHGAPPVAALLCFELALRAMRPDHVEPMPADEPASVADEPAPAPATSTADRPPRRAARVRQPARRSIPLENLIPVAETAAADLAREGRNLSRRSLQEALKAAGHPVGTTRATELLDHLRSRPPLALVEASP
jgi:hypothetical protein